LHFALFRHSPSGGANDEKAGLLGLYPGLRLLRNLALGYHLSLPRSFRIETDIFSAKQLAICHTASWQLRHEHCLSANPNLKDFKIPVAGFI